MKSVEPQGPVGSPSSVVANGEANPDREPGSPGHHASSRPAGHDTCDSCMGSGEYPTDYGMVDCPDCGGSGHLPSRRVMVEHRLRDIERAVDGGLRLKQDDMRWLLLEIRTLRQALRTIVALSHDGTEETSATTQIRRTAEKALGEGARRRLQE